MHEQTIKILYIEDNQANLVLIRRFMQRLPQFELLEAETAETGLELIRRHQPTVVLMDINLPGMNGFAALEVLKQEDLLKDLNVIAISANALVTEVERGIEAGFDHYLTKPIDFKNLTQLLEEISSSRLA